MLAGSLEDNILTLLVHSAEHAANIAIQIAPELFSTPKYRTIAQKAGDYILVYGRPPGVHMRDLLEKELTRGDDGKIFARHCDDMDTLIPDLNAQYVLDGLAHFIASRKLAQAIEDADEHLRAGDLEGAERALYQRDTAQASSPGIWLHDAEAMLKWMNVPESDYFTSGIDALDVRGVRPARGELFLIIGAKKIGKSWWAIELGKQNIQRKKKVLHITLENSEDVTAKRYIQALYAMTASKSETVRYPIFKRDQLGRFTTIDYDQRVAEGITAETAPRIAKKLRGLKTRSRLLMKQFPTGSLTISQLTAYLDQLARNENFRPDLLVLDSINRMSINSDKIRTDLGQLAIKLRGVAVSRNIAIVTTTHSNRAGDSAKVVSGAQHVGEDYSLTGTADTVCTISRTKQERENGRARIFVDASRNAEDKWLAMISQNFMTGQFAIDSVYMAKHVEQEIERLDSENDD